MEKTGRERIRHSAQKKREKEREEEEKENKSYELKRGGQSASETANDY